MTQNFKVVVPNVRCNSLCGGELRTMNGLEVGGIKIGLECTVCRSLFLSELECCELCDQVKPIVKIRADKRCVECLNLFLKRHKTFLPNEPITYKHNNMRFEYACPFCLDVK